MNHLISGANYFIEGLRLIFKPGLRRFVIIPCIINIILFTGLFILLSHYIHIFNTWFEGHLPTWLQWMSVILWLFFLVGFILIFIYTFVIMANLISAPFNGLLAEKVEFFLTGKKLTARSVMSNLLDIPRILGRQFAIVLGYLPLAIIIFILFFVPMMQMLAAVAWFFFNAWFITLLYVDFPTDNHRIPLRVVRTLLKKNRWSSLGFGIAVLLAMMIPVLNFIAIPAAVAGATKYWLEDLAINDIDTTIK
ncbi:MAG: hypothetical protein A3F11_03750 [Gammaproteobacteria bacterium RIFCSPHIGHO2_12_FULL_37_14]|nr:MAG: hypothetical protein A3F11_03750 [Gammaproteobacteria bacterium RIFCSPHIGHO2_12_FULL_37_14]